MESLVFIEKKELEVEDKDALIFLRQGEDKVELIPQGEFIYISSTKQQQELNQTTNPIE
jgi:hypothetical protein